MHSTEPVISSKRLGGGRVMSGFPAPSLLVGRGREAVQAACRG